jgi:hypothetical protein
MDRVVLTNRGIKYSMWRIDRAMKSLNNLELNERLLLALNGLLGGIETLL